MRTQVRSLASLSGLRIQSFHELWCSVQTWLGSHVTVAVVYAGSCTSNATPSLGPSICLWGMCGPKSLINEYIHTNLSDLKAESINQSFPQYAYLVTETHMNDYHTGTK